LPITLAEDIRPMARAAKWLPTRRGDRPPHASCLFRWAKHGLRGVRLETLRVGGTLCTSREALERFFARLAETDDPHAPASPAANLTPLKPVPRHQREIAEAKRQAEAALR
jgi:hypothetical protein